MPKPTQRVKKIIAFIENLIVPSGVGQGKPIKLRKFQKDFLRDIYRPIDARGKDSPTGDFKSRKEKWQVLIDSRSCFNTFGGARGYQKRRNYSLANDRAGIAYFQIYGQIVRADRSWKVT